MMKQGSLSVVFLVLCFVQFSCIRTAREPIVNGGLETKLPPRTSYQKNSNGWYWVYQGIAHGQFFVSKGQSIRRLVVRVARHNNSIPDAPLEIEIRSASLKYIYAHGTIDPERSALHFNNTPVTFDFLQRLDKDRKYVLLFYSQDTDNTSPWVINAIYEDLYPQGRHLGYSDDLFFEMRYSNGTRLFVGPKDEDALTFPINSGSSGGLPALRPLTLSPPWPKPGIAESDPLGEIPLGTRSDAGKSEE